MVSIIQAGVDWEPRSIVVPPAARIKEIKDAILLVLAIVRSKGAESGWRRFLPHRDKNVIGLLAG
jgi:hypothetical protein